MTKTFMIIYILIAVAIGLLIGWLVWGKKPAHVGMHQMPDGTMMADDGSMASMMHDMNANLRGKRGDDFDKAFLDEMIVHHEGAVEMAGLVLGTSKRKDLVSFASGIIAAQSREIEMMKQWRAEWFK